MAEISQPRDVSGDGLKMRKEVVCAYVSNSIESEVHVKRLLLLGRLITDPKIAPAGKILFDSRVNSYFNPDINLAVFFIHINASLCKYNLNT